MLVQRRVMSWRRVWKSFQAFSAHGLLFSFTLLLALRLDHVVSHSWWFIFTPLWLFHAVIARGRFSLPAPSMPHDRHWAPFHSVMATPLLVAFEILLCVHLEDKYVVDLKIVFLPLLAFEVAILVDNVRMCRTLMPGDEETMSDEAIWETLPHFWVSISMVFFIAATTFTLLKLCGDVAALGWWDLFINFGIAECFAFLVCTKWSNQSIHRYSHIPEPSSSSMEVRYLDWNRGLVVTGDEEHQQSNRICGLQDIGGHVMKIPFITFQIILFMRLEGTPASARNIPILVLFVPLFLLQGAGILFATYRLVEKSVLLISSGGGSYGRYFTATTSAREFLGFFQHGARLLGWWSIDEGSREEQARLYSGEATGYNTFSPEVVKKMPKSDLVEEIWRLQAALSEQTDITNYSQQEYEKLQNEKILCRVCFEDPINVVLLPCRHHVLCRTCCEKCKKCPICRVLIEEVCHVFDV
uniref:RING finger protein B n=1 Tax=Noccaea caerulescens TaxID=107243 RepID=A0A1J3EL51_NOCCA